MALIRSLVKNIIVECLFLNRYVLNFNTNFQTVIYRNEISV